MFLDTETNGLPVELDNFLLYDPRRCLKAYDKARMTSLAYIVTTSENMVLDEGYFVSSEDLDISQKITCLTGISKGDGDTPTRVILERLFSALENYDVKYLVAHNVEFDKNIVLSEMLRFGLNPKRWLSLDFKCTYAASGKKLEHCVEEFLAEKACNLHNAKADTEYCRKLFFWLKHRVRDRLGGLAVPK